MARWIAGMVIVLGLAPGAGLAQGTTEVIQFNGFFEGDVVRDQYRFRGVRIPADPAGGPYIDDAGSFAFLLDTPPGLLSLNPLALDSGPGRVHSSVGTYVFQFVDPTNPFVPSFTDHVDVAVALIDKGDTVLTAYDAGGSILATYTLSVDTFTFEFQRLSVAAAGIQRVTLTTPLVQPTIGCLLDTLAFGAPAIIPSRAITIDVKPGSKMNTIRLNDRTTVTVAILSEPGFEPALLDTAKVLFQQASPVSALVGDRNRDRVADLVLGFRVADLVGLDTSSTEARLTAVDTDGTPLAGVDAVRVTAGPPSPFRSAEPGAGLER